MAVSYERGTPLQGILAHQQVPPTRTLQKDIPRTLRWSMGRVFMRVVHLHSRITTRTTLEHFGGPCSEKPWSPPGALRVRISNTRPHTFLGPNGRAVPRSLGPLSGRREILCLWVLY